MSSLEALFQRDYDLNEPEVQEFVRRALDAKSRGDDIAYQQICDMLKNGGGGPMQRQLPLISSLAKCTAMLNARVHHSVVSIVLNNCWRDGEDLVDAAETFCVNCVSVNAELVPPCIKALVKQFLDIPLIPQGHQGGDDDELSLSSNGVHRVLQRVIETFPIGTTTLLSELKDRFPHKRKDCDVQRCFLENVLRVLDYVPQILAPLLDEVVDRLVQIDVEIIVEDFVDDDADGEQGGDGLFDMELADTAKGVERKANSERAEKLDAMMLIVLDFLNGVFSSSKGPIDRDVLFQTLLDIFDRRILTTFRSKYTQFLLFYASHFRTRYIQQFLSKLLQITTGSNHPDATLLAASCYCGSYLARAGFCRPSLTTTALRLIATWLHEYIDAHTEAEPDPEKHSHFYVVAQSLMYALCFKLRTMMSDAKLETMVKLELRLDMIVACKLNPLKVVSAAVADQFVKVALQHKALDRSLLSPIIKRNAKTFVRGAEELSEEIGFFPFDPYLLAASKVHIDTIYQDWQGAADSDEDDDEWAAGIGSNSEHSASLSSRHQSIQDHETEESIAMSLSSQLSLSDALSPESYNSPSWRPMSFSPPKETGINIAGKQGSAQRKSNFHVGSSNSRASPGSPVSVGRPAVPAAGSSQAKPGTSLSVDVPATSHAGGGVETPSKSKRRRVKREDDDL